MDKAMEAMVIETTKKQTSLEETNVRLGRIPVLIEKLRTGVRAKDRQMFGEAARNEAFRGASAFRSHCPTQDEDLSRIVRLEQTSVGIEADRQDLAEELDQFLARL